MTEKSVKYQECALLLHLLHTGICHDIICMECECSVEPSARGILHLVWFGWIWFGGGGGFYYWMLSW